MHVQTGLWQLAALDDLVAHLSSDEAALAIVAFGSCARPEQLDAWSDVDLALVVADAAWDRFYPTRGWLASLGTPLGVEAHPVEGAAPALRATVRVCFDDMRRVDFVLVSESFARRVPGWSARQFAEGHRVLFSRSPAVDEALSQLRTPPDPPVASDEQFRAMVDQFWLKAALAVTKVMRDDLLVGLHLALDLTRDCCVLGMMLRDRQTGTTRHRVGGPYNDVLTRLDGTSQPYSALGILESIEQSGVAFDALAREWSDDYRERREPLVTWIGYARGMLRGR